MKVLTHAVPITTIVGAAVAVLLAQLGLVKLSTAEQILIGLVALLAIDAFVERLGILYRIERQVSLINNVSSVLRPRVDLPHPALLGTNASAVDILAVSGVSLFTQHQGFYCRKLDEGAVLRIILLDPSSDSLATHAAQTGNQNTTIRRHIESTVAAIVPMFEHAKSGQLELRLAPCSSPFSIVASDLDKAGGKMVVEFHVYQVPLDQRPHIILDPHSDPRWYGFYRDQFRIVLKSSRLISKEDAIALAGEQPQKLRDQNDETG